MAAPSPPVIWIAALAVAGGGVALAFQARHEAVLAREAADRAEVRADRAADRARQAQEDAAQALARLDELEGTR